MLCQNFKLRFVVVDKVTSPDAYAVPRTRSLAHDPKNEELSKHQVRAPSTGASFNRGIGRFGVSDGSVIKPAEFGSPNEWVPLNGRQEPNYGLSTVLPCCMPSVCRL